MKWYFFIDNHCSFVEKETDIIETGEIQRVGTVCLRTNRSDIIKCQPDFAKFMSVELILHCNSHIL